MTGARSRHRSVWPCAAACPTGADDHAARSPAHSSVACDDLQLLVAAAHHATSTPVQLDRVVGTRRGRSQRADCVLLAEEPDEHDLATPQAPHQCDEEASAEQERGNDCEEQPGTRHETDEVTLRPGRGWHRMKTPPFCRLLAREQQFSRLVPGRTVAERSIVMAIRSTSGPGVCHAARPSMSNDWPSGSSLPSTLRQASAVTAM